MSSASIAMRNAANAFVLMRPHQWLKNGLVLVPLLTSHRFFTDRSVVEALLAFVAFSLAASSVYVLNDLLDVENDREHPTKRSRPFASGALSPRAGYLLWPLLLLLAVGVAVPLLPLGFVAVLCVYYALTAAYSFFLKRYVMVDVLALAGLYTLRIIAGAQAVDVPLSFWLLAFSMFMFLSLALVKRYAELTEMVRLGSRGRARGRGYRADDLPMLASLGSTAGYIAVLVLALYINDERAVELYENPGRIWLACPLLLAWVSYAWMLAHRGAMNQDPVLFAARDRISLVLLALVGVVLGVAL